MRRAALAVLLWVAGCEGASSAAVPAAAKPAGPVLVRVLEAKAEKVEQVVEVTGTLAGQEEVTIAAEVEGRVEKIVADLGDLVAEGATVVQLAASELRLRAEQAEAEYQQALAKAGTTEQGLTKYDPARHAGVRRADADLAEARRNLTRGEELVRRGVAAQGDLDTLRTRERVADAALQAAHDDARSAQATALARRAAAALAREQLRDATITSPVKGAVARRLVNLGEYVKVGQAVSAVVTTDPLELRVEVPERYVGRVTAPMPVDVEVDALAGSVSGTISRVGPAVAVSSRTFPVEALVPNPDGRLKPGLFARARIRIGETQDVIAVPETAVSSIAGVVKVFVEDGGRARERKVTVLRKRGGDALVSGELRAGERVIITAIARLSEGAEVKVDVVGGAG